MSGFIDRRESYILSKIRESRNSKLSSNTNVKIVRLPSGQPVSATEFKIGSKTYEEGTKLGINRGYYVIQKNGNRNLNLNARVKKFKVLLSASKYYRNRQEILNAIELFESGGIKVFEGVKTLIQSNPEENLTKKFINPSKASMGADVRRRKELATKLSKISRVVYINSLFRKMIDSLKYVKLYDETLEKICCIVQTP